MNLHTLVDRQNEMFYRWENKRRNPLTGKLVRESVAVKVLAQHFLEKAAKGELLCALCKLRPATVNRREAQVRPCETCKRRRRRHDQAAQIEFELERQALRQFRLALNRGIGSGRQHNTASPP